jgi:GT2 family glycosyltransferase
LTCKLVLPDGRMDKDVRRRFPTPRIAFLHLVLGKNKDYWYEDIPENKVHEVEAIQGAFFLTWKKLLDEVGWFDEHYFFDGEDIDLCYRIHEAGYKLFYYPEVTVTHLKGVTKGKVAAWKHKFSAKERKKLRLAGVASMERFFRKNLWKNYPLAFDYFVIFGINVFKIYRYFKVALLSSY